MDQLLELHLHLVAPELVTDEHSIVKTVHYVLLEVLLHRRLCAPDQRQLLDNVNEFAYRVFTNLTEHIAVHLHQLSLP